MIDCPNGEMRDRLPDLLHERLHGDERVAVEAHVAGCAACRAELALLARLRGTMRRAPAVDVGAIVGALPSYDAPVRRGWGGWRAAAAVAAIAIGGASVAVATRDTDHATGTATVAMTPAAPAAPAPAPSDTHPAVPAAAAAVPSAPVERVAQAAPARELGVAGVVADLSDRELAALLADLESLDATPSGEVESSMPVTPVAPAKGAS